MRFATISLGLFLAVGISAVAVPTFEQRQVLATRGENLADNAGTTLRQGEEETADEDITWNTPRMYSSRSVTTVVVSVVLPALTILATYLRFLAQGKNRSRWTADGILVVANCIILVGSGCLTIVGATRGGIGANLGTVDESTVVRFRKIDFVSEFFYISTVGVVKLALLLYYRRIFVFSLVSPGFRVMNNIMLGIVGAWMIAFYIATILQGRPISWNWTEVGTSINLHDFFIAEAVTDITLDTIVLCMPTLVVYRMRMETRKKALVIAIFGLGFFCTITSAIRLYYVTRFFNVSVAVDPDGFADAVTNLDLWSLIEPCASTICVCLPCMGPLVRRDFSPSSLLNSVRAIFSIRSNGSSEIAGAAQSESNNQQNDSNATRNCKNNDIVSEAPVPGYKPDNSRHSGSSSYAPHKAKTTLSENVDQEDIVAFGGSTEAHPLQSMEHAKV
ncbi:uncharacterized protein TRUGW13939_01178 [Talaromyces rugulosus]|uniref:Rhodopsin domain-containing protein n=1 Tax=Talaromyces rugulosus TaxID=121627 RepID=A0A7H8QKU5_TALRU|nr:uncharacterized protein TRUGW13939_01178 [Talaromyces rugulosus]QKX54095.1 hypothetical protein TRUGW13939_01178 [Talaromyces rugulosus]